MRKSFATPRSTPQSDSSSQIEMLFAKAGSDIQGIEISSPNEAMNEIEELCQKIQSTNEWDEQVSGMRHGMALVNGGALEYDCFVRNLSKLHDGLASAATNMRSALVKASCLFISQLARELGSQFEICGDFITPLAPQLSHGTQIISNSCKYAILNISKYCPSRRILASVIDLSSSRGANQKAVAAECFSIILSHWPVEAIGTNWPRLLASLQKLLADASPNVRSFARKSAKALQLISPQKSKEFLSKLDQRTRKAISEEADTVIREPRVEISKRRAPSAPSSARKIKSTKTTKKETDLIRPSKSENIEKEDPFIMIEGQERVFISIVKEYTDDGNSRELFPHMKDISLNILKCCSNESPAISVSSLAVLHDLIQIFPSFFEPNLPLVVNILLNQSVSGCPRAISNAEIILQELPQHFDVNDILKLLINSNPSLSLLHFISNLAEQPKVDFEDQTICFCFLSNASKCASFDTNKKTQQIAAQIIGRVFAENEDAFNSYTDTLSQSEINSFQLLIKPYFPTIELQQATIEVPQYSSKEAKESLAEIQHVIETAEEGREWNLARARIYTELNQALLQSNDEVNTALIIAEKALHFRGFEGFEKLFPGIIFNARGPLSKIAEISLTMILHGVELDVLLRALQPCNKSDNPVIAKNSIDYQTKIISTISKNALKPLIPVLIPTLVETLKNKVPQIRKATVLCYVELCVVMGSEMNQYLKQLEKPQQKLIKIFLTRRTGK